MNKYFLSNTRSGNIIVILFAICGFFFTGYLMFPYGINWDSAHVFSFILNDGHAYCNNWLGWYFPLLWELLYKITGFDYVMGTYIHVLYWGSVALLFLSVFHKTRINVFLFIPFAFFPTILLFVGIITNNALLFVTILLGIALYFCYMVRGKIYLLILSFFTLWQCVFIRRESIFFILPIFICFLFVEYRKQNTRFRSLLFACMICAGIFVTTFCIEKSITSHIANYQHINTLGYTSLWDLTCMSHYKGGCLIPRHCIQDNLSERECVEILNNMPDMSLINDVYCAPVFRKILRYDKHASLALFHDISLPEIISAYAFNIRYYVRHRKNFISNLITKRSRFEGERHSGVITGYQTRQFSNLYCRIDNLWNQYDLSRICFYFYLVLFYLLLSWKHRIVYDNNIEKTIMIILCFCSICGCCVTFFGAPSTQVRYIGLYISIIYYVCYIGFVKTLYKLRLPENNGDADRIVKQD